VIHRGPIVGELPHDGFDAQRLGLMMGGVACVIGVRWASAASTIARFVVAVAVAMAVSALLVSVTHGSPGSVFTRDVRRQRQRLGVRRVHARQPPRRC